MDVETAKTLQPGMRVRITKVQNETATSCDRWFFKVGDEAELLQLDTTDDDGDWYAKFSDGRKWFIELAFGVDYEVIDSH